MCEVDFKKEALKIKKYIKRMFGITNINVKVVQTLNGFAGYGERGKRLVILTMAGVRDKAIIWHEVGHIMAKKHKSYSCSFNEVEAQMWSMNQMIKKGYHRMYSIEIKEMIEWATETDRSVRPLMYKKAGKEVLRRLYVDYI